MNSAPSLPLIDRPQLNLLDKATVWASLLLAGFLFLTVGWFAMEPDDPMGAVSLLTRDSSIIMLLQATALIVVTASLATALAGRKLADAGIFAAAVGLAAVSLRGGTVAYLLMQDGDDIGSTQRSLAMLFALEAVAWCAALVIAIGASGLLVRWCFLNSDPSDQREDDVAAQALGTTSASDIPGIGVLLFGGAFEYQTGLSRGIRHALITTVVGLAAFYVLSTGTATRAMQHGQACFVVAASVYAGCYVAHRLSPARSALWSILAVGLMAVAGYVWSAFRPDVSGAPITAPNSPFLRVLPIQFVSVGTAVAVAMFWQMYVPPADTQPASGRSERESLARNAS